VVARGMLDPMWSAISNLLELSPAESGRKIAQH
jgi:hypothetical protein